MRSLLPCWAGFAISCGDSGQSQGASEPASCAEADYAVCGSPLPAEGPGDGPWPTFSQALAEAEDCGQGSGAGSLWFEQIRGVCADGKQFIWQNGGFTGMVRYFEGERLVGVASFTDIYAAQRCTCPLLSFRGTLESVRCESPQYEALCETTPPETFEPPFALGTTYCGCDDEPGAP